MADASYFGWEIKSLCHCETGREKFGWRLSREKGLEKIVSIEKALVTFSSPLVGMLFE